MEKDHASILTVDCDISLYHVEKLYVKEKINEHTEAWFTAGISEEDISTAMNKLDADSQIKIKLTTGKEEQTLFEGMIYDYRIRQLGGLYKVEFYVISLSYRFDIKIKKKSYQNQYSYYEIFQSIIKGAYKGDLLFSGDKDEVQNKTYLQLDETDWAFMKRLASYIKLPIMNHMGNSRPQLLIGFPPREPVQIKEYEFTMKNYYGEYLEKRNNGITCQEKDLLEYKLVSNEFYLLGDLVQYKSTNYRIVEKHIDIVNSVPKYEYQLRSEAGGRQQEIIYNEATGMILEGKILTVKKDKALVQLLIDEEQDKSKARWFPIAASYGNTGKGGSFCVPEEGNQVRVFVSDPKRSESYIDSVIRQDGDTKVCRKVQ